ncbi:extracellular solute-binding protein [Paenibacillus mendelii]|uniref:Extracellular solute-binding protein n=1 Tax=Paenibacillus mendelii TaxID=206163 RepID=A0ABV6JFB7_9BACL|nr:extracellular solute-binding protein [Paenibacillus mendelii]MCQ6557471.1 extracellular solute-binding protein [Paenibacillus mendelii]
MRFVRNKKLLTVIAVAAVLALFLIYRLFFISGQHYPVVASSALDEHSQAVGMPNYFTYLQGWDQAKMPAGGDAVTIEAASFSSRSDEASIKVSRNEELGRQVLHWDHAAGWVEWVADIPEEGLYTLSIAYIPLKGSFSGIIRGIQIDGEYPFAEAQRVMLKRNWKDAVYPYKRDKLGNELRPVQVELEGLKNETITDYSVSSEPLQWHFTKGKHTIRMIGWREPVALDTLTLTPSRDIPDYVHYTQNQPTAEESSTWFQLYEAESYSRKSDPSIQTASYSEPYISPDPKGRIAYNVIGGDRWKKAGEWLEWDIEVPKDSYYELDLKYLQSMQQSSVYHTITVDGEVPFQELKGYETATNSHFQLHTLQAQDGTAYRIYLTKGRHTLRIIADASPITPAVYALQNLLRELSVMDKDMRRITGNYSVTGADQDLNRTWEIKRYDPDIEQKLTSLIDKMNVISDYVNGLSGRKTAVSSILNTAKYTFEEMREDVNDIPNQMKEFSSTQSRLGAWITQMSEQKLMLDYIVLRTPEAETGLKVSGAFKRTAYMGMNFFRTFYMDYSRKSLNKEKAITVWVSRGRDYVDIMQEMIEQQFTPQTGIQVNVNLMPNPNALILGNAAGDQPDVALGIPSETAVEYAMRGAVADLSKMKGFDDIVKRFHPGVLLAHKYDGGTYALPELQNFQLMFYRTDVFEQLGIKPPDTWEDVFRIMPTLLEKGMTFYYPPADFTTIFYQNGAEFWDETGMKNMLGEAKSVKAFKQWTDMFVKHSLPLEVPAFFEHFRLGDLPIGIGDLSTYVQLTVAAPDIVGNWGVAPVPGIRQSDGTVARWQPQGAVSGMIMEKSDKQDQAWKFLDWWTSAAVQSEFGNSMESLYGLEYRWNTANVEAMADIPWSDEELAALYEQGRWVKNVPLVPGHYFLGRELSFAWNRTVLTGMPFMESLEQARIALQREMRRKQEDLGIPADTDLDLEPYVQPYTYEKGGEGHESAENRRP